MFFRETPGLYLICVFVRAFNIPLKWFFYITEFDQLSFVAAFLVTYLPTCKIVAIYLIIVIFRVVLHTQNKNKHPPLILWHLNIINVISLRYSITNRIFCIINSTYFMIHKMYLQKLMRHRELEWSATGMWNSTEVYMVFYHYRPHLCMFYDMWRMSRDSRLSMARSFLIGSLNQTG